MSEWRKLKTSFVSKDYLLQALEKTGFKFSINGDDIVIDEVPFDIRKGLSFRSIIFKQTDKNIVLNGDAHVGVLNNVLSSLKQSYSEISILAEAKKLGFRLTSRKTAKGQIELTLDSY
jgi:hypothetical protein